jgi:hypothetical protein
MVSFLKSKKLRFVAYSPIIRFLIFILWRFSTKNDNNFGHEQITIVVDNMPLMRPSVQQ